MYTIDFAIMKESNSEIQDENTLKLNLKTKVFTIPSDFSHLQEVKTDIYNKLKTNKQYEVKSSV